MADSIDAAKDVAIAFLSASALLLTLILGFISPTLPKDAAVTLAVDVATLALYMSALFSGYSLWRLVEFQANTKHLPKNFIGLYKPMFLFFLIGIALIVAAIWLRLN